MDPKWFGVRLREIRKDLGLTQQELADKISVQRVTLARWENGAREPTWTSILALCEALGVDCTEFARPPKDEGE